LNLTVAEGLTSASVSLFIILQANVRSRS